MHVERKVDLLAYVMQLTNQTAASSEFHRPCIFGLDELEEHEFLLTRDCNTSTELFSPAQHVSSSGSSRAMPTLDVDPP